MDDDQRKNNQMAPYTQETLNKLCSVPGENALLATYNLEGQQPTKLSFIQTSEMHLEIFQATKDVVQQEIFQNSTMLWSQY